MKIKGDVTTTTTYRRIEIEDGPVVVMPNSNRKIKIFEVRVTQRSENKAWTCWAYGWGVRQDGTVGKVRHQVLLVDPDKAPEWLWDITAAASREYNSVSKITADPKQ